MLMDGNTSQTANCKLLPSSNDQLMQPIEPLLASLNSQAMTNVPDWLQSAMPQLQSSLQTTAVDLDDLDDFSAIDESEPAVESPKNFPVRPLRDHEAAPKKPKRLSSYNLFFQVERQRILDGTDHQPLVLTAQDVLQVSIDFKAKPKRKHRKSHGQISFLDLARTIAKRWKVLDKETKRLFEDQAVLESDEYRAAYKDYKRQLEKWNARNETPTEESLSGKQKPSYNKTSSRAPRNTKEVVRCNSKKHIRHTKKRTKSFGCQDKSEEGVYVFGGDSKTGAPGAPSTSGSDNGCCSLQVEELRPSKMQSSSSSVEFDQMVDEVQGPLRLTTLMYSPVFVTTKAGVDLFQIIKDSDLETLFD